MLVVALFLVLFSNHMEERLRDGRSVLRVDCRMTDPTAEQEGDNVPDEKKSLLPQRQVRKHTVCVHYCIFI